MITPPPLETPKPLPKASPPTPKALLQQASTCLLNPPKPQHKSTQFLKVDQYAKFQRDLIQGMPEPISNDRPRNIAGGASWSRLIKSLPSRPYSDARERKALSKADPSSLDLFRPDEPIPLTLWLKAQRLLAGYKKTYLIGDMAPSGVKEMPGYPHLLKVHASLYHRYTWLRTLTDS